MAELLKNIYTKKFIESFLDELNHVYPKINKEKFARDVFNNEWEGKELKQRMRHITQTLGDHLPQNYAESMKVLLKLANNLKKKMVGEMSFEYMFVPDFIEVYGLEDFKTSIQSMEEITQLASAEFAIRPFILNHPEKMFNQLLKWSKHENAMVRRLASEGSRPRLPWGMGIPVLKKDPTPILPILENLKDDESETVRRSVANNLNDISKDHPQIVFKLIKKWKGKNKDLDKLVKHASRTLLKKAHPETMDLFGIGSAKNVFIDNFIIHKNHINIGEELQFEFNLTSTNKEPIFLRVEYAIDYLKANGKHNKKKFKITENTYLPKKPVLFQRKQSFRNMTTRKHYPGSHSLSIYINGKEMCSQNFYVK